MKPFSSLTLSCVLTVFAVTAIPNASAQIALRLTDTSAAPVTVQSADITTEVTGRLAVTTFDLVFANPNNRVLEGTFEFPLLDGQRVVRFALDINGALREAVPVEKEKGRVVFEEIERRRVDPGLLEQTAGNNYRARIFPIPANGTRRVVIAYQEDLATRSNANAKMAMPPRYQLALDFPNPLKTFSLTVRAFSAPGEKPAKASTTLSLNLPDWSEGHVITVKKENFTARGVFDLELPATNPGNANVLTQTFNGREYFYAEAALPASLANKAKPRPAPKTLGILWDASGSGRFRDHEREFALLDAWFAAVRDVDVKLVCFRNTPDIPLALKVRAGNWAALRAVLEKTIYDGATSFDGLSDATLARAAITGSSLYFGPDVGRANATGIASVDEWMLFSDGLVNFGATQDIEKLPLRAPVHTLNASASSAPAFLRRLAARGGGEFVDLLALDAKTAVTRLRQYSARVIAIERDPEAVAQVFPEAGAAVNIDSGALVVTGILRKSSATVRMKIGFSNADAQTVEIPVQSGEGASALAARAWAIAKIENLATAPGDNRKDIRGTSQEFRIVTADTSLIVLETLDDYIRYDIEPPAEDSQLHAAWLARCRNVDDTFNKNREQQIERVVRLFNDRVAWWEKEFPKDTPKHPDDKKVWPHGAAPGDFSNATNVDATNGSVATTGGTQIPWGRPAGWGSAPAPVAAAPSAPPSPQTTITSGTVTTDTEGNEVVVMGAFNVTAEPDRGYAAMNTVSGARVNTALRDTPASILPFTKEFLSDVGASTVDNMVSYAANVEADGGSLDARGEKSAEERSAAAQTSGAIALQPWSPVASYLDHLRRVPAPERFAVYLEERADHAREPGFYLDVASYFFDEAKDGATALQILSNLAELGLEDATLLRALGYRLVQAGRPDLALPVFERVLKIRGEEPQSRRDLALVCASAKLGQYQRAVDLLWEVVSRQWDDRFPEIELIALDELNAIVATCGQNLDVSKIDSRLLKNLPVGLRVVLTWDADNCDIDLWVDDPNGERAMYDHPLTYQGGRMSKDFTEGYGPEEFLLRKPKPGKYTVHINYFGESAATALGPVTAQVRLITDFGTPQEKEKLITVRLVDKKDSLEIGSIEIGR